MRGSEAALMKEPAETSWKCFLHHQANAALSERGPRTAGGQAAQLRRKVSQEEQVVSQGSLETERNSLRPKLWFSTAWVSDLSSHIPSLLSYSWQCKEIQHLADS